MKTVLERVLLLLATSLLLNAADDWPMADHDSQHSRQSRTWLEPPLTRKADLLLPDGDIGENVISEGKLFSTLSVREGISFPVTYNQYIQAIDIANGQTIWSNKVSNVQMRIAFDKYLFVSFGYPQNEIAAFSPDTGSEIWRHKAEGWRALNGHVVENGKVFVIGTSDKSWIHPGMATALDAATGKKLWETEVTGSLTSQPSTSAGKMFFVTHHVYNGPVVSAGGLYALDTNSGEILWKSPVTDNESAAPVVAENRVFVFSTTYLGQPPTVYCVSATTGETLWEARIPDWGSLAVGHGRMYLSTFGTWSFPEKSHLLAFDQITGTKFWEKEFLASWGQGIVVSASDYLLHFRATGLTGPDEAFRNPTGYNLSVLNASNGSAEWETDLSIGVPLEGEFGQNEFFSSPKIAGNRVYLLKNVIEGTDKLVSFDGMVSDNEFGSVSGRVVDYTTAEGLGQCFVELWRDQSLATTAVTISSGEFRFVSVLPASYELRIQKFGYVPARQSPIIVSGNREVTVGSIRIPLLSSDPILPKNNLWLNPTPSQLTSQSLFSFSFLAEAQKYFLVEYKNSLSDPFWKPLRTIFSKNSQIESVLQAIPAENNMKFCRVRVMEDVALSLRFPLSLNKHWLLTTEVGDEGCTASDPPEPSHTDVNRFSLDFSPRSKENEGNAEVDVPVLAAAKGMAIVGEDMRPRHNGYYVILDHDLDGNIETGFTTRYLHLQGSSLIKTGDIVEEGEQIGLMGGSPDWPVHLHIGLRYNGNGGSNEETIAQLRKVLMAGLPFESYKTECKPGTGESIAYYPR